MRKFKGLPASPGYAIGVSFVLSPKANSFSLSEKGNKALELLEEGKKRLREELERSREKIGEEGEIFFAHSLLLEDPEIWDKVKEKISKGEMLGVALQETKQEFVSLFEALEDERFKSRADDVKDILERLGDILSKDIENNIPKGAIIVGSEILPSHIIHYEKFKPKGYVSETGSPLAHSAIIARAKGIPMVTGCRGITGHLKKGDILILDGDKGEVIVCPTAETLRKYQEALERKQKEEKEAFANRFLPAITNSGRRVKIYANVGNLAEVEEAKVMGAEGIGIFRTEFLLLEEGKALKKEEHLRVYEEVAKTFYPLPVHIRLFDIGADKHIPFLRLPQEPNPALGLRGVRLLIKRKEILFPQLEAIKEVFKGYDNVALVLPMVSFIEEVKAIKELAGDVPIGVMVETPASALLISKFARFADFISIGTNDLLQYTLAVDRAGKNVEELYCPTHPALWKLIGIVIRGSKKWGKEVGVCGEIASERAFIPRLIRIGVDHLSVSPKFIPLVKHLIRSLP